jgi:hypothetical protein
MSKEHYYIIKWSKSEGWEFDPDTEEARFPNGTVWNGSEWEYPYEGDGVFNDNNDLVSQDLMVILSQANERQGANV